MWRWIGLGALVCCAAVGWGQALPPLAELRARAVASYDKSEAERERYLCREHIEGQELDGHGAVKKTEVSEREIFFVHGVQISQVVSKDGRPLSPAEQKKQDEKVKKRIEEATAKGRKAGPGGDLQIQDILRLAKLANERRVTVAGRPTIVFDIVPGAGKIFDVKQALVAALAGTVSVDEASGNLQDVNAYGTRDVKVGGGLVADLHKGFQAHIVIAPEADGVWLIRSAEGAGDARVGLFVKEGGRFRQETEGCRLYDVSTVQGGAVQRP